MKQSDDDDDDFGTATEKCGFFCHIVTALITMVYTVVWLSSVTVDPSSTQQQLPVWMKTAPATAVFLFYAAPLLYGLLNTTLVAHAEDVSAVHDAYTRTTTGGGDRQNKQYPDEEGFPEIYDLDVGDVNDLLWEALEHREST